jgi:hypothetical protein
MLMLLTISLPVLAQKEPDISNISDFEKEMILNSIKELGENFKAIAPSNEVVTSIPLSPENLVPLTVDAKMLKALGSKLSNAFFLGTTWSSSVDIEFDSFILPHMDVVTKIDVTVDELSLDDGTKKKVNLIAVAHNSNRQKSFKLELSKDLLSSPKSADPKISSLSGMAKVTYYENFTKTSVKVQVGTEVKMKDGGMVKVIQAKNDFVQVQFSGEANFYDVYADDGKGIDIEALTYKEMPLLKDGKPVSELAEKDILMFAAKENSGQSAKTGVLFNLKFKGVPANIHFLSTGKKKELIQKFIAYGKQDGKDASKILGTRYINEKSPIAFSFSDKELTENLTLSLRRDSTFLAYLDEGPRSNELILDLENIKKIQYEDRIIELSDVQLLDEKGKAVPIFVKQKDSFGDKKILIQVPKGADGNTDKKELLKAKKPIFPNGQKLIGKIKLEVPLVYEVFSWPAKPYPGVKVEIKGNDIIFGLGNKNDFKASDFYVSDGSDYALFPFGKNHTKWVNDDVEKIERYWGKPKNVLLRAQIQTIVYEGQFEFKVPAPLPTPAKDANPFINNGPKPVIEQFAINKLKNFSSKIIKAFEEAPAVTPSAEVSADESKMYDQVEALYIKKGLTKEMAKETVGKLKESLKSLTKEQRATSLQGMISALK